MLFLSGVQPNHKKKSDIYRIHKERSYLVVSYLVAKVDLVLKDRVVVSIHTDAVREHFLLVEEEGVCAEVVGEVDALVDGGPTPTGSARRLIEWAICRASHLTVVKGTAREKMASTRGMI